MLPAGPACFGQPIAAAARGLDGPVAERTANLLKFAVNIDALAKPGGCIGRIALPGRSCACGAAAVLRVGSYQQYITHGFGSAAAADGDQTFAPLASQSSRRQSEWLQ